MNIFLFYRDGNLSDIANAGSLHEFLLHLHQKFGPIASFWIHKLYVVSIASAKLFEEHQHTFDRPRECLYFVISSRTPFRLPPIN